MDESDYEFEFDFLSDRETGEEEWHHDTGEETFVSEPHVAPRERRPTPPEVVREAVVKDEPVTVSSEPAGPPKKGWWQRTFRGEG